MELGWRDAKSEAEIINVHDFGGGSMTRRSLRMIHRPSPR